jgi:hypothetical protein
MKMSTSLEKAWSEGLDTESAKSAREEVRAAWNSAFVAFPKWMEESRSIREEAGLSEVVIEEYPLEDEGLARLILKPPLEREYYQLQIAALYAVANLADAINGLENPTGWKVTIVPSASSESWWEAGAFALIRGRARALSDLIRQSEECLAKLVSDTPAEDRATSRTWAASKPSWMDPLTSAFSLIGRGHYEAALPQLLLALRAVVATSLSVEHEVLPYPLAPHLHEIDALTSVAPHVPLLEAACEQLGTGLPVTPGAAIPLSIHLHDRIQELALTPPDAAQLERLRGSLEDFST